MAADSLTPAEQQLACRLTSTNRRRAFQVGRWLGKQAVSSFLESSQEPYSQIEILSEDTSAVTSRPVVCLDGIPIDLNISITHLDQTVAVAVTGSHCSLGIDLARVQPVTPGFADIWLTKNEQRQMDTSNNPALTAAMNWSTREATFKATGIEDEFRPARWSVVLDGNRANCFYQGQLQPVQLKYYQIRQNLLLTVASDKSDVSFQSL